ncbi:MAG: hypothetical protein GW911_18465, partial [Armatimonadetes bacterium]|nr:hypothetical protein [Armatimonadota bacterium]NDK14015.1 hypothetical protein [Armatimonadota bacterium]
NPVDSQPFETFRSSVSGRSETCPELSTVVVLTCQDWLHWVAEGHVDEVLLEETWSDPKNEHLWAAAQALVGKADRTVPLTPVIRAGAAVEAEVKALGQSPKPTGVVLRTSATEDLPFSIRRSAEALARG